MKTVYPIVVIISLLIISNQAKAQLMVNAGEDLIVCNNWYITDTVILGGEPSASGGNPPYTYSWHREPSYIFGYTASYFLNDTTISNPQLINPGSPFYLYLTVTDNNNNTVTDSIYIDFYVYDVILGYMEYFITQGDSIYLNGWGSPGGGGTPPYSFVWRPNEGLLDSTSLSFWAKPNYSVAYYLSQIDANGCEFSHPPVYYVYVSPTNIDEIKKDLLFEINPNPIHQNLKIRSKKNSHDELIYFIYDSDGKIVFYTKTQEQNLTINTQNFCSGAYYVRILKDNKIVFSDKIIKY